MPAARPTSHFQLDQSSLTTSYSFALLQKSEQNHQHATGSGKALSGTSISVSTR